MQGSHSCYLEHHLDMSQARWTDPQCLFNDSNHWSLHGKLHGVDLLYKLTLLLVIVYYLTC